MPPPAAPSEKLGFLTIGRFQEAEPGGGRVGYGPVTRLGWYPTDA